VSVWCILGPILGTAGGFFAGWLSATERLRGEIYTRRLDMYQKLNQLASELLLISIKAEAYSDTYREKTLDARLALSEFLVANALLVSARVGPLIAPMLEATLAPNIDKLRTSFNATVEAMAHDLRLNTIDRATKFLLPFEKSHKPLQPIA
jgi:hypothetical protein